jgi:hypothetical protein
LATANSHQFAVPGRINHFFAKMFIDVHAIDKCYCALSDVARPIVGLKRIVEQTARLAESNSRRVSFRRGR